MKHLKKITITLLLTMLITFSLANVNVSKAVQPSSQISINFNNPQVPPQLPPYLNMTQQDKIQENNALQFLSHVFKINTASYNVTALNTVPAPFGNFMTFDFNSSSNMFQATTEFNNNELIWCILEPTRGSPAFTTSPSTDVLSAAENALDGIQLVSPQGFLPTIQSMLKSSGVTNSSITSGNFRQEIVVKQNDVTVSWEPSANGLSNQQDKLILGFQDGNLMEYSNFLSLYTIGNTEVNIPEQEAIQIATAHAEAYSWQVGNETVSNVTVLASPVVANISLQNRGNATLYPLWNILLPLDKMYPGGVTSFRVLIWADTGQISSITPVGSYGIGDVPTATPAAGTSPNQAIATDSMAIIIALVTATMAISGYLFYKRKR